MSRARVLHRFAASPMGIVPFATNLLPLGYSAGSTTATYSCSHGGRRPDQEVDLLWNRGIEARGIGWIGIADGGDDLGGRNVLNCGAATPPWPLHLLPSPHIMKVVRFNHEVNREKPGTRHVPVVIDIMIRVHALSSGHRKNQSAG